MVQSKQRFNDKSKVISQLAKSIGLKSDSQDFSKMMKQVRKALFLYQAEKPWSKEQKQILKYITLANKHAKKMKDALKKLDKDSRLYLEAFGFDAKPTELLLRHLLLNVKFNAENSNLEELGLSGGFDILENPILPALGTFGDDPKIGSCNILETYLTYIVRATNDAISQHSIKKKGAPPKKADRQLRKRLCSIFEKHYPPDEDHLTRVENCEKFICLILDSKGIKRPAAWIKGANRSRTKLEANRGSLRKEISRTLSRIPSMDN